MLRIGIGYDLHRMAEGRSLFLAGVKIPCEKGPVGHSDADVLLHAVCDALLGACSLGDIGSHFPDTEAQYTERDERHTHQTESRMRYTADAGLCQRGHRA